MSAPIKFRGYENTADGDVARTEPMTMEAAQALKEALSQKNGSFQAVIPEHIQVKPDGKGEVYLQVVEGMRRDMNKRLEALPPASQPAQPDALQASRFGGGATAPAAAAPQAATPQPAAPQAPAPTTYHARMYQVPVEPQQHEMPPTVGIAQSSIANGGAPSTPPPNGGFQPALARSAAQPQPEAQARKYNAGAFNIS